MITGWLASVLVKRAKIAHVWCAWMRIKKTGFNDIKVCRSRIALSWTRMWWVYIIMAWQGEEHRVQLKAMSRISLLRHQTMNYPFKYLYSCLIWPTNIQTQTIWNRVPNKRFSLTGNGWGTAGVCYKWWDGALCSTQSSKKWCKMKLMLLYKDKIFVFGWVNELTVWDSEK